MVQIFSKSGFREESYSGGFQVHMSRAFIEKHGKKQVEDVCREIMLHFREVPETVPAFNSHHQYYVSVDKAVNDRLKFLASQRGISINVLVRESLHCHLLKRVEPVSVTASKPFSTLLCLSPFEEELLKKWKEINSAGSSAYLSTLASVTEPLQKTDLAALTPRQALTLYPDPEFLEDFHHSVRVYGYLAGPLFRQILAFLDRPFDPKRLQDRYLDWLTGGYITKTLLPSLN